MNSAKLHGWLEIIGIAAVVASLLFVGLQLKQSQDIAIAGQYQARFETLATVTVSQMQSGPAMSVIGKETLALIQADDDIPESVKTWALDQPIDELGFQFSRSYMLLKSYDNHYYQYQSGYLTEEAWQALLVELRTALASPYGWHKGVFEANPALWRESYRKLIEELIYESNDSGQ